MELLTGGRNKRIIAAGVCTIAFGYANFRFILISNAI